MSNHYVIMFADLAKVHKCESEEEEEAQGAPLPKKMDMYTLRHKLQQMDKRKKKLTVYEVLRNEIVDILDAAFRWVVILCCP